MRLHRLGITAFGPFSGTEEVDFDTLGDAGIFLIHGPTGAGKTSILDAVCFALYGSVPGARAQARSLRSDHALPGAAPRVELEVTVRGRTLRITRSPRWRRDKKRGSGTVEEQPRVTVSERRDGGWTALSTRLDEAGQLIRELLGMSAQQFCQVAMLPQGDFARFLRAGAEDRRVVLQQLFATETFADVERWLVEQRKATGREAAQRWRAAERITDRIAEVSADLKPDDPADALTPADTAGGEEPDPADTARIERPAQWAAALLALAARASEQSGRQVRAAAEALAYAAEVAAAARDLHARRRRHADALARRDALATRRGERAQLAATIDAAQRADRVIGLIEAATDRAAAARQAADVEQRAVAEIAALIGSPDTDGELPALIETAQRDRTGELARLAGLREQVDRQARVRAELAGTEARIDAAEATSAELAEDLATLPEHRDALRAHLADAREAAAGLPAAEQARLRATERLTAARDREELAEAHTEARAWETVAIDRAQDARDRQLRIRADRLAGMASELAGDLTDGRPCPVCGGVEHPDPAVGAVDAPTAESERLAQQDYERAVAERTEATGRVHELAARLDAAQRGAAGLDTATAAARLAECDAALESARSAERTAARAAERLDALDGELASARARAEETERELTGLRAHADALRDEHTRLRERLDAARGDDPDIGARIARLDAEVDALHGAAAAVATARSRRQEHATAADTAERGAAAAGFDGTSAAAAAAVDAARLDQLRAEMRAIDDETAAVRDLLADPELVAAAAEPAPDPDGADAEAAAAAAAHTAAAGDHEAAQRRHARLTELVADLDAALARWRPAAGRAEVAARVAGLAAGTSPDNRLQMKLSAYVLAARLRHVVAAANERLAAMSGGRYALRHTVQRAAGDRRTASGGLGLAVVDGWTGVAREPATLSGGESFIGSLALALGLADVVTAESDGAQIATLFVDEGFGSLDEEALDEVMDVLDELRDGGRSVALVSHVAELRARIPVRLRVAKTRQGSTIAVHAA